MIDPRQRAFTLLEMIVVIAILSVIATISFRFVITTAQWYDRARRQSQVDEKALATVTRLEREVRMLTTTLTASNTLFRFVSQNGQTNLLQCTAGNLTWNGYLLADGATVAMTYYDSANGVTTNLGVIRRIGFDLQVADGTAMSDMEVNFFYPEPGTIK